jgi:hypothetical protein
MVSLFCFATLLYCLSLLSLDFITRLLSNAEQRHVKVEDAAGRAIYYLFPTTNCLSLFIQSFVLNMDSRRHSTTSSLRTPLAHALRRIFRSVKTPNAATTLHAPVDIIRKDDSRPVSYLPCISQLSSFPEFELPDVNNDDTDINNHAVTLPMTFDDSNATQFSRTLLPAKSLSHFNLHQAYTDHSSSPILRPTTRELIRPAKRPIPSNTGHVASHKPRLASKKSTLRIERLDSLHGSVSNVGSVTSDPVDHSTSVIRRTKGSGNLRKCARGEPFVPIPSSLTPIAEDNCSTGSIVNQEDSSHLVKHFASFCIIDLAAPGCPVTAVSEDLGYLYDIKDRFVLNAQEVAELSMDLSIGRDPDGNEVTYLLLFSPLVAPATSKSRFMLVSAIDVSGYIRYAASMDPSPEPEELSISSESFSEKSNPSSSHSWLDERTDQLADELLHGCSIKEVPARHLRSRRRAPPRVEPQPSKHDAEDIWTAIAREEGLMVPQTSTAPSRSTGYLPGSSDELPDPKQRTATSSSTAPPPSLDYADEKVVGRFIESLQELYSQYFLLACSPLNGDFYEICYVSPSVYASGEFVSGHLSHTPFHRLRGFAAHLAAGRRFRATIRWGEAGVEKQVFCVPLMGQQPAPWICVLVDRETPISW